MLMYKYACIQVQMSIHVTINSIVYIYSKYAPLMPLYALYIYIGRTDKKALDIRTYKHHVVVEGLTEWAMR